MIAHRSIIAWAFKAAAGLIGIPSAIAGVGLALDAMALHRLAAPDHSHMLSIQKYGLVGLLNNGAVGVNHVLGALSGLAAWALGVLATLAFAALLAAIILFLIGRGLAQGAAWARVVSVLALAVILLVSVEVLFITPHAMILAPALLIAGALYAIWALIWRFEPANRPTTSP